VENDPDAVMRLFTQQSDIAKGATMESVFQKDPANGRFYRLAAANENAHATVDGNRVIYVTESDLNNMRNNTMGVAQRFSDIFYRHLNVSISERDRGSLIKKAGTGGSNSVVDRDSAFDKKIADMERNITRIQNRFFDLEKKYFKQFAQMETAMTKLNKQASFLMGAGE